VASASTRVNQGPRHFSEELETLKSRLLAMGALAEERLRLALQALVDRNQESLAEVIAGDSRVDDLRWEIDSRCLTLLALHQPVAIDLRTTLSALKINADLERVAALAVNIGKAAQRYLLHPPVKPLIDVPRMGHLALKMLREALDAFVSRDVSLALTVLTQDDWVDAFKNQIFRELLTYMLSDRRTIEPSVDLIFISRHIERVGDHATNIAEDVIFIVEARDVRHRAGPMPTTRAASATFVERRKTQRAPLL
jgi:phosphate transport system protein